MRLDEIARRLECVLKGPDDLEITGVAGIEEAEPDQLTFLSNPKYRSKLKDCKAGAVLAAPGVEAAIPRLLTDNPYLAFARAIELFYQPPEVVPGIHPTAWVADSAELGDGHAVGAHVVVGEGVCIGRGAVLHPNVVVYPQARIGDDFEAHSGAVVREHVRIGHRVTLQNGAVIGADGFGFAPDAGGEYHKMVQSGLVILEDDVEIGANTCIDRATVGETRIEKGVKIDNLVQIGHGSRLGRDTVLAAQVGLAGSTKVGRGVLMAGQVGVAGHLTIGDNAVVTAQSGVGRPVEPGSIVSGSPEMETKLWKKNYLLMHRFPELFKTVRRLEKELEELKKKGRDEDA